MSEEEQLEAQPQETIDIHDTEALKKLWYMLRDTQNSSEIFTLTTLLIDSLPYDFISKNDNWLFIAQKLDQHGEDELASLFKLANQRAFELSLQGK